MLTAVIIIVMILCVLVTLSVDLFVFIAGLNFILSLFGM